MAKKPAPKPKAAKPLSAPPMKPKAAPMAKPTNPFAKGC